MTIYKQKYLFKFEGKVVILDIKQSSKDGLEKGYGSFLWKEQNDQTIKNKTFRGTRRSIIKEFWKWIKTELKDFKFLYVITLVK